MKVVRICGIDYDIIYSDPGDLDSGGMGLACQLSSSITLRSGLSADVEFGVLIHEVMHMILDMNGVLVDNEELVLSVLSTGLTAFLLVNDLDYVKK